MAMQRENLGLRVLVSHYLYNVLAFAPLRILYT